MGAASKQAGPADKGLMYFPVRKQLRNNYSLIPLVACVGFGCALAAFHGFRLMFRSPDVVVNRKGNPRPYERLIKEDGTPVQWKYFSSIDYNTLKDEDRPPLK
jgi:hypothetical protein